MFQKRLFDFTWLSLSLFHATGGWFLMMFYREPELVRWFGLRSLHGRVWLTRGYYC